jgi:glycerophosphoryl diester phosphodiesterase
MPYAAAVVVSARTRHWAVGLVVLGSACSTSADGAACPQSEFRSRPPHVIAHAGGEGLGPANSILAMRRSVAAGADILDVDVWMTADGVVVAAHDRSLEAATGLEANIDEVAWGDLQQLDLRHGWVGPEIDVPVRVPSLDQILNAFPDEPFSIEIKQHEPSIADALCHTLQATDSVHRVYLSANVDATVYDARNRCDGVLITTTYADVDEMRAARTEAVSDWCAPAPIGQPPYEDGRFDRDGVAWSHAHGLAIFTWTVDDPAALRHLAEVGVDGVYTRRPDIARAIFDEVSRTGERSD